MTTWVPTGENPTDLLTKVLYGSRRRHIVVMSCVISAMSISNFTQYSGDLVVLCIVVHRFARYNLRQS